MRGAAEFGVVTSRSRRCELADLAEPASRASSIGSPAASRSLLKGRKVTVVAGTGVLEPDGRTLSVSDGTDDPRPQRVDRDRLGAARARRRRSRVRRRNACCRRTTCCSSTEVPARVAVIGGGAIGCEFASFLVDVGRGGHDPRGAAADPRRRRPTGRADGRARVSKARDQDAHRRAGPRLRRRRRSRFEGKNGEEQLRGRQGRRVASGAARARRTSGSTARA